MDTLDEMLGLTLLIPIGLGIGYYIVGPLIQRYICRGN